MEPIRCICDWHCRSDAREVIATKRLLARPRSQTVDDEETLQPYRLEAFLARAMKTAHKIERFEKEWHILQYPVPTGRALEQEQALFQEDLTQVTKSKEEMEYLSLVDCYASVSALKIGPDNKALQS